MTLKEAMVRVFDNAVGTYPEGWNTKLATIIRDSGRECYERKQKRVWELMIRTPYNGEAPTTTLYRSHENAKAAMEDDIRETLASGSPRFDADDLVRTDEDNVRIGDEIFWEIERKDLND